MIQDIIQLQEKLLVMLAQMDIIVLIQRWLSLFHVQMVTILHSHNKFVPPVLQVMHVQTQHQIRRLPVIVELFLLVDKVVVHLVQVAFHVRPQRRTT